MDAGFFGAGVWFAALKISSGMIQNLRLFALISVLQA